MGRMLEALRHADLTRGRPVAPGPKLAVCRPETRTAPREEELVGIPFIEVGGPNSELDASSDVLRSPAAKPLLARGEIAPHFRPVPATPVAATEPAPARVFFRPIPEVPAPHPVPRRVAPELIAFHRPEDPLSAQYRALLANLVAQMPDARPHVWMFTAPAPGVGTTTVLLNVAVSLARQGGLRVLVVDANLYRPAIADRLGILYAPGLQDVLAEAVPLPRALQETGQGNLQALTAGTPCVGGTVRLGDGAMRALLRQLRERFDVVFLDAPCWDGRPELAALGSACDAIYLVLPHKEADSRQVDELVRTLPHQGCPLRGSILTQR
jgi:Mrp family chromosome partitioning ATPase